MMALFNMFNISRSSLWLQLLVSLLGTVAAPGNYFCPELGSVVVELAVAIPRPAGVALLTCEFSVPDGQLLQYTWQAVGETRTTLYAYVAGRHPLGVIKDKKIVADLTHKIEDTRGRSELFINANVSNTDAFECRVLLKDNTPCSDSQEILYQDPYMYIMENGTLMCDNRDLACPLYNELPPRIYNISAHVDFCKPGVKLKLVIAGYVIGGKVVHEYSSDGYCHASITKPVTLGGKMRIIIFKVTESERLTTLYFPDLRSVWPRNESVVIGQEFPLGRPVGTAPFTCDFIVPEGKLLQFTLSVNGTKGDIYTYVVDRVPHGKMYGSTVVAVTNAINGTHGHTEVILKANVSDYRTIRCDVNLRDNTRGSVMRQMQFVEPKRNLTANGKILCDSDTMPCDQDANMQQDTNYTITGFVENCQPSPKLSLKVDGKDIGGDVDIRLNADGYYQGNITNTISFDDIAIMIEFMVVEHDSRYRLYYKQPEKLDPGDNTNTELVASIGSVGTALLLGVPVLIFIYRKVQENRRLKKEAAARLVRIQRKCWVIVNETLFMNDEFIKKRLNINDVFLLAVRRSKCLEHDACRAVMHAPDSKKINTFLTRLRRAYPETPEGFLRALYNNKYHDIMDMIQKYFMSMIEKKEELAKRKAEEVAQGRKEKDDEKDAAEAEKDLEELREASNLFKDARSKAESNTSSE